MPPTRRDVATTATAALALAGLALAGTPRAQVPPPFGLLPRRAVNHRPELVALFARRPTAATFGGAVVEYARLALGNARGEHGRDNAGAFVDFVTQTPPTVTPAWCAGFLSACYFLASYGLQRVPPWSTWRYGRDGGIDAELWVPTLVANARAKGRLVDQRQLERVGPGAALFVRQAGSWAHVGIVEAIEGGQVRTIEGNVGASTSATGLDLVKRLTRSPGGLDFGTVD